ncbi:MAG: TlpA family protein disulfide reductase [Pseudomonadales bacterium]
MWLLLTALFVSQSACAVELGEVAPDFSLPILITADQNETQAPYPQTKLSDHRGSAIYLDFWSSACQACRLSLPTLSQANERFREDGLVILSVNLDVNPTDAIQYLAQHPLNFAVASDPSLALADVYNVKGLPTAFFIDSDGTIQSRHEGFRTEDAKALDSRLVRLLDRAQNTLDETR